MKVQVVYIHPLVQREIYDPLALKFSNSLGRFPVPENTWYEQVWTHFRTDASDGKDIGAYLHISKLTDADIMVCIGSHVRINHEDWLERVMQVWTKHGPGLYGPFGSEQPVHHLRTTAFWCSPHLLRNYPWMVDNDQDRYNFELGKTRSITSYAMDMKLPVMQVTADAEYGLVFDPSVDPRESLMLDRFTDMALASK